MKQILLPAVMLATFVLPGAHAAAPVVSNIRAGQIAGTKNVEILYDVSDAEGDALTIALEITDAPLNVQELFEDTFDRSKDLLAMTDEIADLAREYLQAGVVPLRFEDDARHVATCTVHRVNHLVSWNFKHLVNVRRTAGFNAVNLLQGYPPVSIVNPKELIYGNDDEQDF